MSSTRTSVAVLPKTRHMFSERISPESYRDLCRKTNVPDVARFLRAHPYFKNSLAPLTDAVPHRGRIEELLRRDIFFKYERLSHYVPLGDSFGNFFILDCEINELLLCIRLIEGGKNSYITSLPSFLTQRLGINLMGHAEANSFEQIVKCVEQTPYGKILKELENLPSMQRLMMAEAQLKKYYYKTVLKAIDKDVPSGERRSVKVLFLKEIEQFNISLIIRIKRYFNDTFRLADIKDLRIPYSYRIGRPVMETLCKAEDFADLCELFTSTGLAKKMGVPSDYDFVVRQQRELYRFAARELHLSSSPAASLAAFIMISKFERQNVINVIEGVRYKLPPEEIEKLLRF